ncbi:MAG: dehydrogenase [Gammaproteobacteria bacterium]|nr:dehydrogenase [Gammaproteobacteria bacterium]
MSYMLLIHENRGDRDTRSPQEALALYQEMTAFAGELARDGLLAGAESLKSDKHAIRLQERDGELQVLDGPFAESKEMVGGFFLLNCEDREQALAIAKRCPAVRFASVVIRELAPCHEG